MWSTLATVFLWAPAAVDAAKAFALEAGPNWLGIDGRWSTFDLTVGKDKPQVVSLTVSTALAETWIIENTACQQTALCYASRGGVYNFHNSTSLQSIGGFELGLNDTGWGGNGDYGLETVGISNPTTQKVLTIDSALVAGINDSHYWVGVMGVGALPGGFGKKYYLPIISQLVETLGEIPSHSYGYTAGASYIGGQNGVSGTPASLTLGGYDANRLVQHDVSFNINPATRVPQVLLRGITANVPTIGQAPGKWDSTSRVLSDFNDSSIAWVDTTTPYLWLPAATCDRFADALGLTWNDTFGLYFFKSDQDYARFQNGSSLNFTFSLSSFDNTNNFGQPFNTPGVVNITVSSAAFALTVQYPFNPTMQFRDKAIPYFPLMRSQGGNVIIGRAFMQEAYIVTRYEENTFSLHQAVFSQDGRKNTSIIDIQRPPNSDYAGYNPPGGGNTGLSTAAIAGVIVAAFVTGSVVCVAAWCCRRRRRRNATADRSLQDGEDNLKKDTASSVESEPPSSPIERFFSFIIRRKKSTKRTIVEAPGSTAQPVEVANHELYEMPVPPEPVELDSTNEGSFGDDTTVLGTEGSENLSPYEVALRKLQRQLQGPVPTYTPPVAPVAASDNKTEQDVSPVAHYRPPPDDASPISSPTYDGGNGDSLPDMLPSPMTPRGDWSGRFDVLAPPLPPITIPGAGTNNLLSSPLSSPDSPRSPATTDNIPSSMSRSSSSNGSATPHSPLSLVPPSAAYQRTPIDPSRVICLGPLPENIQPPQPPPVAPRVGGPDGRTDAAASSSSGRPQRRSSTDTLGSNFTVDEENRAREEVSRQASRRRDADAPHTPQSAERIDAGFELVHVPQLAEKRYSWEEGSTQ